MNRIVYFSGVHGSGKSTLIEALKCRYPESFVSAEKLYIPKIEENVHARALVRYCQSYTQWFDEKELCGKYPERFVVRDRSWHDHEVYGRSFVKLGWMPQTHQDDLVMWGNILFGGRRDYKLVYVNPPLEYVKEKIQERWQKTGIVKWREDNFEYLKTVYESYQELIPTISVEKLEITETNLEGRVEKVVDWLGVKREAMPQNI